MSGNCAGRHPPRPRPSRVLLLALANVTWSSALLPLYCHDAHPHPGVVSQQSKRVGANGVCEFPGAGVFCGMRFLFISPFLFCLVSFDCYILCNIIVLYYTLLLLLYFSLKWNAIPVVILISSIQRVGLRLSSQPLPVTGPATCSGHRTSTSPAARPLLRAPFGPQLPSIALLLPSTIALVPEAELHTS